MGRSLVQQRDWAIARTLNFMKPSHCSGTPLKCQAHLLDIHVVLSRGVTPRLAAGVCLLLLTGCMPFSATGGARAQKLLWSEDFNGAAGVPPSATTWTAETGGNGWGNQELETYTANQENVSLDGDGHLTITARREKYAGKDGIPRDWTSARITTLGKHAFQYGRIEVRAKMPSGQGFWPAAWTMGTSIQKIGWPACGENDIVETVNQARHVSQSIHGPKGAGHDWILTHDTATSGATSGFHTYGADWKPDSMTFLVDGKVTGVVTPKDLAPGQSWPLNSRQYLLLNVAVGGNHPGAPDGSTPDQASMKVDWIRVYDNGSALPPSAL